MSYVCSVKEGDLLNEEDATFIVNASNMRQILGSGASIAVESVSLLPLLASGVLLVWLNQAHSV